MLYGPAPSWVEIEDITDEKAETGNPIVLYDRQIRLEEGRVTHFTDIAFALSTPQALTAFGNLQANWLPDKGDLTVNSVELIRDGKAIDLLAGGAKFDVIRREAQLESRVLSGLLTATMSVPGAQIGDIVRLSHSITLSDQAMGKEIQLREHIPFQENVIREGEIAISWPKGLAVNIEGFGSRRTVEPVLKDGFYYIWEDVPGDEMEPIPSDAPARFRIMPQLQASTFADWREVSKVMAPHFATEGLIAPGSEIADAVARIAAEHNGAKARAAAALQLVQDEISYLANGMDGGNYLPQSPEETWQSRYGDCKAKSLLLLAMLRELDVDGDIVLVQSTEGDAVSEFVPMPAAFDHMIVRAEIDGESYWLDGTNTGSRLANIEAVPRFHYALPLVAGGADLMAMTERPLQNPINQTRLMLDYSAGVDVPMLFSADVTILGPYAAFWRQIESQPDEDTKKETLSGMLAGYVGENHLTDFSISFDDAAGTARVTATGLAKSAWSEQRERMQFTPPGQVAGDLDFDSDRTKAEWRDLPLALNGPLYQTADVVVKLPKATGFALSGEQQIDETVGGYESKGTSSLDGQFFTMRQSLRSMKTELDAAELTAAKREVRSLRRAMPEIKAPADVRRSWDYRGSDRKQLAAIDDAFAKLVKAADSDDVSILWNRAEYRRSILDFAGAKEDLDTAIERSPEQYLYFARAQDKTNLGDLKGAIVDYRTAEEMERTGASYFAQLPLLAELGRTDEMADLVDDYYDLVEETHQAELFEALALDYEGKHDEAYAILTSIAADRPGDSNVLNAICWHGGTWDRVNAEVMSACDEAVTKSGYSPQNLDSRALAFYRSGEIDKALADYDAALGNGTRVAEIEYMRGVVRLANGDASGQQDVDRALAKSPNIAVIYGAWGL
ncbi:DUF3857 domain-containing protein [Altererythrobacter aurantiacus]|uniref:DUF3857 domain-containing protein n=1 Tax=Parapontixanthobacter aurantiacus TaxID=1463599 RepID=A0A844ZD93_9SPHN|nr:DUF3857 domain-containing protein [Parapontixanthobacter aurantiacus]